MPSRLSVQIAGAEGRPLSIGLKGTKGLKELDELVVKGGSRRRSLSGKPDCERERNLCETVEVVSDSAAPRQPIRAFQIRLGRCGLLL